MAQSDDTFDSRPGADASSPSRRRLLQAAAEVFADRGFAGTSIAAIAESAGVSKSTIFHHFESKQALYLAVIEAAAGEFARTLDQVLSDGGSIGERLSRFQQAHLEHLDRNRQVARLVLRELQGGPDGEAAGLVSQVVSINFARLVEHLRMARDSGEIRTGADVHVAALTLFAMNVFRFQYHDVLAGLPGMEHSIQPRRFTQTVCELLVGGLRPTSDDERNDHE